MLPTISACIVGCYQGEGKLPVLTPKASVLDQKKSATIANALTASLFDGELQKTRYFYNLCSEYTYIIVAGLGDAGDCYSPVEEIDLKKENVRIAISKALKICSELSVTNVKVDDCEEPSCVGEVVAMTGYSVGQWKSKPKPNSLEISLLDENLCAKNAFDDGRLFGEAQMMAASLSETPANLKTPVKICQLIKDQMPNSVVCIVRDKEWIENKKMGLTLSVSQGSNEPPRFLEAHYHGANHDPVVLVGKGITFDSGGISLKPPTSMSDMKSDMQGAAVVFSAVKAAALMKLPINLIGLAPFTENMPSGSATRPGDVYSAMNGVTVEVDNTDAEGRLVLGDALAYAETFSPSRIVDFATLTGAVGVALGGATCAIYSQNKGIVDQFRKAAAITGDRVWHMPLFKYYTKLIESDVADLINCTKKREAGSCTAAAFLQEFVKNKDIWAHLDIASTVEPCEQFPYLPKGKSGRPVRTLIEFLRIISQE